MAWTPSQCWHCQHRELGSHTEARVTQYDQPIDPIKAPRDAKMYKTLREFEIASEHLSE